MQCMIKSIESYCSVSAGFFLNPKCFTFLYQGHFMIKNVGKIGLLNFERGLGPTSGPSLFIQEFNMFNLAVDNAFKGVIYSSKMKTI